MRRALLVLAFAASFLVGAWFVSDAAPGDLLRTNNAGGNQVLVPQIAGTPCWRVGNQTLRPSGVAFSACATTSTSSTSASSTTEFTTSLAPTTTAPANTSTTSTSSSTTSPPASTVSPTTTVVSPPPTSLPSGAQFVETFDDNGGRDRFRWGVFNRDVGYREMDQPEPFDGCCNNSLANGTWGGDHDLNCGPPDTQRTLEAESIQNGGQAAWTPSLDFHTDEVVYVCANHVMSSMGAVSAFTVLWFGPDVSFPNVDEVTFDVNLTDELGRKWWKVGVVSDSLWNTTCPQGINAIPVRCLVVSDVGSSGLDDSLQGSDRLIATFGGAASAGSGDHYSCLKIGNPQTGVCRSTNDDKMTRYPVRLTDNNDGTVTFDVAGTAITRPGSFPVCPCHVVFYDQNYTPDKDGVPQSHSWHWDQIVVR